MVISVSVMFLVYTLFPNGGNAWTFNEGFCGFCVLC